MPDNNGNIPDLDDIVLTPELIQERIEEADAAVKEVDDAINSMHEPYRSAARVFLVHGQFSDEFANHLDSCIPCQKSVEILLNWMQKRLDP